MPSADPTSSIDHSRPLTHSTAPPHACPHASAVPHLAAAHSAAAWPSPISCIGSSLAVIIRRTHHRYQFARLAEKRIACAQQNAQLQVAHVCARASAALGCACILMCVACACCLSVAMSCECGQPSGGRPFMGVGFLSIPMVATRTRATLLVPLHARAPLYSIVRRAG